VVQTFPSSQQPLSSSHRCWLVVQLGSTGSTEVAVGVVVFWHWEFEAHTSPKRQQPLPNSGAHWNRVTSVHPRGQHASVMAVLVLPSSTVTVGVLQRKAVELQGVSVVHPRSTGQQLPTCSPVEFLSTMQ
jgi:hypothetical protein